MKLIEDKIIETTKKTNIFRSIKNIFTTTKVCSYTKIFTNNIKEFLKIETWNFNLKRKFEAKIHTKISPSVLSETEVI